MLIPLNPTMKIIAVITAILPIAYAVTATVKYPPNFSSRNFAYRCTGIWQTMKLNMPVSVYWHGIDVAAKTVKDWNTRSITPGAQAAANLLVQGSSISMHHVVLSLNIQFVVESSDDWQWYRWPEHILSSPFWQYWKHPNRNAMRKAHQKSSDISSWIPPPTNVHWKQTLGISGHTCEGDWCRPKSSSVSLCGLSS